MKTHKNEALTLYSEYFNCCQSILGSFGPDFDLNMATALKLGAGFSGGMAFHGETCGAVIGACIILGLANGSDDPSNDLAEQLTYVRVKEFLSGFKKKFGTTACNNLLNTDVSTPEGFNWAQESGLFKEFCPKFVAETAEILDQLLQRKQGGKNSLGYFNEIAFDWDKMRKEFFSDDLRNQAILQAKLLEGNIVVDLGSGSGFITEGLVDKPVRIIAVDQSPVMIDLMKQKFSGSKNIEYKTGISDSLPLKENSVDVVFANMYLHHTEDPSKAINEVYRILKPGGRFILVDLNKHNHRFLVDEQFDVWMGFDQDRIKSWMGSAGFTDHEIRNLNENCCANSTATTDIAKITIFLSHARKG